MTKNLFDYKFISNLLKDSNDVLIGVSGGKDSMALLHQILQYREKLNKNIKVLHIDHQLNADSGTWSNFVQLYCDENNVPVTITKVNVERQRNLEMAARKARYAAYTEQEFDTILLGHHANDQIETFFMKLFRGSGVRGLGCMDFISECWFDKNKTIVRPLLDKSRLEIDEYIKRNNIPHIDDTSNSNTDFDRNWIRHILIPTITKRNEIADINILKSIKIQGETIELLSDLAYIDYGNCKTDNDDLDWSRIKSLSFPRLKNLIMVICNEHGYYDISTHNVEHFAMSIINSDENSRTELRIRNFRIQKIGKVLKIRVIV